MEGIRAGSAEYKIAREVLVFWIGLHKFKGVDDPEDGFPWDESTRQAHVDVVGPKDTTASDALLNEPDRITRQ